MSFSPQRIAKMQAYADAHGLTLLDVMRSYVEKLERSLGTQQEQLAAMGRENPSYDGLSANIEQLLERVSLLRGEYEVRRIMQGTEV